MPTIAATFRDYQTRILDLLDAAAALLRDDLPAAAQLDGSRNAIGSVLDDYQAFKHRFVYDPIIAAKSDDAAAAAALKADCTRLSAEYRAYCNEHRAGAAGAFAPYRHATLEIANRIRLALIREFELVRRLRVYPDYAARPVG